MEVHSSDEIHLQPPNAQANNNGDTTIDLSHSAVSLNPSSTLSHRNPSHVELQSSHAASQSELRPTLSIQSTETFASFIKCTGQKVIFNDISYTVGRRKKKRKILNNINGCFLPGQLSVIMGSTGAGKSTLIDIIAGRDKVGKIGGKVTINGVSPKKCFNHIGAYIQQTDLLMGTLSVFETIKFYADLHLEDSEEKKTEKVDQIISMLGLTKVRDTIVGSEVQRGISGGELKRTAIGCGLVTDPGIIILDEPTSGLDSYNALKVVQILKVLASAGKTVFCTVHQPSSGLFELFDSILLLHLGRSVYFGPLNSCLTYFGGIGYVCPAYFNPADYYIDVLNDEGRHIAPGLSDEEYHSYLADRFDSSNPVFEKCGSEAKLAGSPRKINVNFFLQYWFLAVRNWKNVSRDPRTTFALLGQTLFLSILIGTLYLRMPMTTQYLSDRFGVLFFVITNQAFGGFSYLNKFMEAKELFMRERASGDYHISAYFLAVVTTELPGWLVFPILFSTIVYWMTGLVDNFAKFVIFVILIVLQSICATSLFVMCGAVAPNPQLALVLSPIIIVLFMLFGGFYISLTTIPPWYSWFGYLSFFRYSMQGLVRNTFGGENYTCVNNSNSTPPFPCDPVSNTLSGNDYIQFIGFGDSVIWHSVLILIGMILFYRICAFAAIYFFHRSKK